MNPTVSIVIVNFNSGGALAATLASLQEGLGELEWEAIVIDNASEDGSDRAAVENPGVNLIRNRTNVGFAAGANAGVGSTSGSFVLLLNPDCRLKPGAGPLLVDELRRHEACALIGPRLLNPDGTLQESARGDPTVLTGLFGRTTIGSRFLPWSPAARRNLLSSSLAGSPDSSSCVDWVSGACMLARRDALGAVGGFDEHYFLYWEDADLCRRLRQAHWQIRYMPGAVATHDVGQSSRAARSRANVEFHRSAYRYFSTHVVPQKWHPGRLLGWAALMLRSKLKT